LEDFSNLVNWDNVYKYAETFKKGKPIKWVFVEEFFERGFYEKLYATFPKYDKNDKTWTAHSHPARSSKGRLFNNVLEVGPVHDQDDLTLSKEWNKLKRYLISEEFTANVRKLTGLRLEKLKILGFIALHKGDFSLPHIDTYGAYKLNMIIYFSKNWQKDDPGGTWIGTKEDESSMFFEPCNLDNSMICFEPSKRNSWHGTRYITKDVVRQALSLSW
jgi:hypothetical protein